VCAAGKVESLIDTRRESGAAAAVYLPTAPLVTKEEHNQHPSEQFQQRQTHKHNKEREVQSCSVSSISSRLWCAVCANNMLRENQLSTIAETSKPNRLCCCILVLLLLLLGQEGADREV
jgi:hypothetical protein